MKYINGHLWINLENHLDMNSFDKINDQIIFAIAKNSKYIEPSFTPRHSLLNTEHPGFLEERIKYNQVYPELDISQLNWYTKLSGAVTLGSHLMLRNNTGYPSTYQFKHLKSFTSETLFAPDFNFLFNWINEQNCFSEYGRVMFWINEPSQLSAFHTDYGNLNSDKKDMFIWLTGNFRKKILIKDTETGNIHSSPYRAMTFNNINWHGSCGDSNSTSWSLRIDGIFAKSWAESVGIKGYFNL